MDHFIFVSARNSGIPSAFIPHQLNYNNFQNSPSSLLSSPVNSLDSTAPPPALMLPPPPSVFLHCTSNSGETVKPQIGNDYLFEFLKIFLLFV